MAINLLAGALAAGASIWAGNRAAKASKRSASRLSQAAMEAGDWAYNRTGELADAYRRDAGEAIGRGYDDALSELRGARGNALSANRQFLDDSLLRLQEGADRGVASYDEAIAAFDPYSEAGTEALGEIRSLLGLSGREAQTEAFGRFEVSPDYEFVRSQGIEAGRAAAAAEGSLQSGGTLKALTEYGANLASQEYGNYYNRLSGVADTGLEAIGAQGSLRAGRGNLLADTGARAANLTDAAGGRAVNVNMLSGQRIADTLIGRGSALGNIETNTTNMLLGGIDDRVNAITGAASARAYGDIGAANAQMQGLYGAGRAGAYFLPKVDWEKTQNLLGAA